MKAPLFAAAALLAFTPQEPNYPTLPIGSAAIDFDLPGVDGKRYSLKDFAQAKALLVIFDTVHCPTSQAYGERIRQIVTDYKEKGVAVVAISPSDPAGVRMDELGYTDLDDSFDAMKLRARDKQITFPFLYDGEPNTTSQAYGPKATPHCFLFDADRKLRYTGRIDDSERIEKVKVHDLRNALDAVLAGKEPPVTVTKASGCSTKWPHKKDQVKKFNEKVAQEPVTIEAVEGDAAKALRAGDAGKVRLIHVWSPADPSQIKGLSTINVWYRGRRTFVLTTVAVADAGKKDEALALLRKDFPPASHKNLLVADREQVRAGLDAGWDGSLPFTLLVGKENEILYKKSGAVDDLELKRAIVKGLGPR